MIPDFSLQHLRFHLQPKATLRMPRHNKGNVIRGAFGSTFKRIVCHANCVNPERCDLRFVCPYTAVFQPFVPEESEKISKTRDIPRPFVIKPPLTTKKDYLLGEPLSFDLILVGKAQEYLPYFIVTFKELAHAGLGLSRTSCELESVEAISSEGRATTVYRSPDNLVRPPGAAISWSSLHNGNRTAKKIRSVRIIFLTPTMLKVDGVVVRKRKPGFSHIAKRLRDRINALSYFYCGKGLDIDFRAFGEQAEMIQTVHDSTYWAEAFRYSRSRGVKHDLSGFLGDMVFSGDLDPFLPYLKLGEYVHVGKNAVFGNGWFQIEEID